MCTPSPPTVQSKWQAATTKYLTLGNNIHLLQLCFVLFHLRLKSPSKAAREKGSIIGNAITSAKKLYLNLNGEPSLPTFIVWPSEDAEY